MLGTAARRIMASTTVRAVVNQEKGKASVLAVPVPKLRDEYILIRTKAVALNPTDVSHIGFLASPGHRIGCDYAGIVEEVGSKVTRAFKKGDRVAGFIHGGDTTQPESGAFGELVIGKGDLQIQIPENLSFEEASTLGVGITTVGQALYQSLKLPLPGQTPLKGTPVLIYGASTATGGLAVQYAKLSGATVIATSSPRNFDYVKSLGADAVFDYNSPTVIDDIKAFAKNDLSLVLDCISREHSFKITAAAIRASGGILSTLLSPDVEQIAAINPNVKPNMTLAYTGLGEAFDIAGRAIPVVPGDLEFAASFWELSRGLLADGKIVVHRPSVNKYGSGLDGVMNGLDAMRDGKVSGEKLVFTL